MLLPVLTYYLTPADYGKLAAFTSFFGLMAIFIGLSIQGAVSVNYYKMKKEALAVYIGNVIYILIVSFLIILLLIFLFNSYITSYLKIDFLWLLVATTMSFASFFVYINLALWLVEQKPKYYGSFEIFDTITKFGLSLLFVIVLSLSWQGRAMGMFIGTIISAIISIFLMYKRGFLIFKYNKTYIRDALHFGIPLVPHQLSFWLRSGAIIFLLTHFVGEKQTGLYNVGAQFVIPIAVLTAAFNKAWAPYLYRKLSAPTKQEKKNIVKFTYLYFIGIILIALSISWIAPYIMKFILNQKFHKASIYVFYLALGGAFQGMYFMVVNYIFYVKKTKYLAYITFSTSLFNVALAYILINKNGALGAAQANAISVLLSFLLVWYYSNKVYKMPWKL